MFDDPADTPPVKPKRNSLYLQVNIAIILGVVVGQFWPCFGVEPKPLGDAFIKPVSMLIAPIIFTTVVAGMGDLKTIGRIGGMALIPRVARFMSEARAITNFIGNAVATLVVAKWDGAFDVSKAGEILARAPEEKRSGSERTLEPDRSVNRHKKTAGAADAPAVEKHGDYFFNVAQKFARRLTPLAMISSLVA